jgi:hypothetical protein
MPNTRKICNNLSIVKVSVRLCVCATNQFDTTTCQLLQCTALCRTTTLELGTRYSYMEPCYQRPALRVPSHFDQWPLWWYLMPQHPTPSVLNLIHGRSPILHSPLTLHTQPGCVPILHSPLTLSPAATLEFDFLVQLRFMDLRTPDPQTTHTHGAWWVHSFWSAHALSHVELDAPNPQHLLF